MQNNVERRWLLREAAGIYWLIDTAQAGLPYRPPLKLNETGARIWRLLDSGLSAEEAAARIAAEEDVPSEEVLNDVLAFEAQLRTIQK